mmetsp:Transcript_125509/g.287526  ORF Transcript_125509/g.287526 Transcript_125509/m.287526 type:complete len:222 (-) Transcript_125509:197-862(-)
MGNDGTVPRSRTHCSMIHRGSTVLGSPTARQRTQSANNRSCSWDFHCSVARLLDADSAFIAVKDPTNRRMSSSGPVTAGFSAATSLGAWVGDSGAAITTGGGAAGGSGRTGLVGCASKGNRPRPGLVPAWNGSPRGSPAEFSSSSQEEKISVATRPGRPPGPVPVASAGANTGGSRAGSATRSTAGPELAGATGHGGGFANTGSVGGSKALPVRGSTIWNF